LADIRTFKIKGKGANAPCHDATEECFYLSPHGIYYSDAIVEVAFLMA